MIFPVGRETDFINQIEGDLEEQITAIPKKLYLQHGKPDSKRWNQVVSEVDAEFAKVPGQKPQPIECRGFCRALTHTLKEYFIVKRKWFDIVSMIIQLSYNDFKNTLRNN
jgi:hypothetical protein